MDKFRKQAEELVNQMTIEEMASQLKYDAPAIKRLGIPGYNWWNEALHGVARAGTATVFPQAIGMAAIFDDNFLKRIGEVIASEARAKYNEQSKQGDVDIYKGLTLWSPNINIFRDPRWGRGQETYGEDPYLTSKLGVAFIEGLQGDEKYLKTAACAKHFAVHSGPEKGRHSFNAIASKKDMEETYLPAFEEAVKEGHVEAVMGAYNRTNGEPCCGSETLLKKILRDKWEFSGHVVSDCWAIKDFHENHKVTVTPRESAALAIKNGCDVNCGVTYLHLLGALEEGLITKDYIRESAIRLFTTRMKLGMFDENCSFNKIDYEVNDCKEHKEINLESARKSVVLLKNNGILPLDKNKIKTIGVIGPTANSREVLEGNYFGTASEYITNLEGIQKEAVDNIRVLYSEGSDLFRDKAQPLGWHNDRLSEARTVASRSDVVILCLGLDATLEGEEGDTGNSFASGDKVDLYLPECQRILMETVVKTGKPVILVLNTGSAMDISYAQENCAAILQCWYSGSRGGQALSDILFGNTNPSGKLPVTFYYNGGLPEFEDYSMKGRTYRYMDEKPLYPFGYGLSYSKFEYSDLNIWLDDNNIINGTIKVHNQSEKDGEDIIQVYVDKKSEEKISNGKNAPYVNELKPENQPRYSLCSFKRVKIVAGNTVEVSFIIERKWLETVLEDGGRILLSGEYDIYVGGGQPDERTKELSGKRVSLVSTINLNNI